MNPQIVLNFILSPEADKAFESQRISVTSGQLPTSLSSLAGVSPEAVSASLATPSGHAGGISAVEEDGLSTPFGPGAAATLVEDASALRLAPMNVISTFASNDAQNAWVNFPGLGWRRIKPGAADGVTNLFIMFNIAKAIGRTVTVYIEDATGLITLAYLN